MLGTHAGNDRLWRAVRGVVFCAAAVAAAGRPAPAQESPSARIDALVQEAVQRYVQSQGQPRPAGAAPSAHPAEGPTISLTLDQAVKLALDQNLDIAVQRANPEMADLSIAGLQATYRPTLTSTINDQRQTTPPTTLLTGSEAVHTTTTTVNAAVAENLPWGGGNVSLAWNNNRIDTDSFFYNFNPAYSSTLTVQFTQPLLRGRRTDATRQQLLVSRRNRDISELQLQTTIVNTLTAVRDAYWDLVFALQSIDVAKQSLLLAHKLVEENQVRVKFGTMTRLDLVTAQAEEASAEHALVLAEGNRRTAELALKRLVVNGAQDPLWQQVIDPVDHPDLVAEPIDVEGAIRHALAERTDLAQAKRQVEANRATLDYLHDQTRPQADLVANYSTAGLGGTELIRSGDIFTGQVIGTIPGGYGNALSTLASLDYPTWTIGVTVSYPIGQSAARAAAARAQVEMRQVDTQVRNLEVAVVTEVTNAAIQVRNSFEGVRSAKVARQAAQDKLDAEEKKFAAGMSTNYFVIQAQRDLADAENAELQADVACRKALVDFQRAQQTTLQGAGVAIVSTSGLEAPAVGSGRPTGGQ
jgi:outer membrane protein TolC